MPVCGRQEHVVKVLPGVSTIAGHAEAEAKEKHCEL